MARTARTLANSTNCTRADLHHPHASGRSFVVQPIFAHTKVAARLRHPGVFCSSHRRFCFGHRIARPGSSPRKSRSRASGSMRNRPPTLRPIPCCRTHRAIVSCATSARAAASPADSHFREGNVLPCNPASFRLGHGQGLRRFRLHSQRNARYHLGRAQPGTDGGCQTPSRPAPRTARTRSWGSFRIHRSCDETPISPRLS